MQESGVSIFQCSDRNLQPPYVPSRAEGKRTSTSAEAPRRCTCFVVGVFPPPFLPSHPAIPLGLAVHNFRGSYQCPKLAPNAS